MFRQFDGYPECHGLELAKFLNGFKIVDGYSSGDKLMVANGMSCLAAQIIAHFKTKIGNFYLYPANTRDCWEEYIYIVTDKNGTPNIECYNRNNTLLFAGSPIEFIERCKVDGAFC